MSNLNSLEQYRLVQMILAIWSRILTALTAVKNGVMAVINFIGNAIAWPFKAAGGCFMLPFRIFAGLWNAFWNAVGCAGIVVITVVLACVFAAFPGPGWVALLAFTLIYVITTVWWLAKRAYNKAYPEAVAAKRALWIGFAIIVLSWGTLALPVAMTWAIYAMVLNKRAAKREAKQAHA